VNDLPIARLREIDFDARRNPKTKRHCVHCQRDLAPDRYVRFGRVLIFGGGPIFTLHPDDVHDWQHDVLRIEARDGLERLGIEDLGWMPFGTRCARAHGVEWTIPEDPAATRPRLLRSGRWRFGPLLVQVDEAKRWTVYDGMARTASDQVGWHHPTLAEAVEEAREHVPHALPPETAYKGS
jgi:hypothetical protein